VRLSLEPEPIPEQSRAPDFRVEFEQISSALPSLGAVMREFVRSRDPKPATKPFRDEQQAALKALASKPRPTRVHLPPVKPAPKAIDAKAAVSLNSKSRFA
jgi:hypothetical protein